MKKILIIIATLILAFNVKAKCKDLNKVVRIGTEVIADSFSCDYLNQIKEDIQETIEVSAICRMGFPMRNVKPKTLCKALGGYAGVLTVNAIPEGWGCTFVPTQQQAEGMKMEVINNCLDKL